LLLVNNTAYALSLAGRPHEAKQVLDRLGDRSVGHVALTATRALADLVGGNEDAGIAGYRRAYEIAKERGDDDYATLVLLNAALSTKHLESELAHRIDVAEDLAELPNFWVVSHRIRRELQDSVSL
jgi:hypothetical protein